MDETNHASQPLTDEQRREVEGLSTNLLRLVSSPSEAAVARGVDTEMVAYAREVLAEREARSVNLEHELNRIYGT